MKHKKIILVSLVTLALFLLICTFIYKKDKNKYEPKLWIGIFDYRLNFRDFGASLNQCLNQNIFLTNRVFRSNKYFSGWSCDKIQNPDKIYSLNYSPWDPHAYFCYQKDNSRLVGIHPNTTFEITETDLRNLKKWEEPEFKKTMCFFFKSRYIMGWASSICGAPWSKGWLTVAALAEGISNVVTGTCLGFGRGYKCMSRYYND